MALIAPREVLVREEKLAAPWDDLTRTGASRTGVAKLDLGVPRGVPRAPSMLEPPAACDERDCLLHCKVTGGIMLSSVCSDGGTFALVLAAILLP